MENLRSEKVERIMDLVEWFEEYQPNDLEHIERIMLGLKYVDNEVVENDLRQDMYNTIKCTRLEKNLKCGNRFLEMIFRADTNETMIKDK